MESARFNLLENAPPGKRIELWVRDDDAIAVTPALERLCALHERFAAPLVLAVIPAYAEENLGAWARGKPLISIAQHGWAHENHAHPGEKKQELGSQRPLATAIEELGEGFEKLSMLFEDQFTAYLVPPWNHIDPMLFNELPPIGFRGVSTYGPKRLPADSPLAEHNSDIDIIDWKGSRGCRDHKELAAELARLIKDSNENALSVGILTHHLVHDESAWNFLEALYAAIDSDCSHKFVKQI